jgi:3-hydroxyacyl-CoA dehydrogenase / enoyl-CoA hydratase / 3-hydroxybutyryl-CoA epimerase
MKNAFNFKMIENEIGILTFDYPDSKANKFNTATMAELNEKIDEIAKKSEIKCLLFMSAKSSIFIAGADISEIKDITDPQQGYEVGKKGHEVFNKIEHLPFPTVAVINGASMGGGTELSLACNYRIASDNPKTKIALPEINLGILPGWGGSTRLPKLIGLQRSLDIILTGKNLIPKRALRTGVIDKIIPKEMVKEAAIAFAKDVIKGKNVLARSKRKQKGLVNALLEKNPLGRAVVFSQAKKAVMKKTHGHYPAPLRALEVIKKGYGKSLKVGLEAEAKALGDLLVTDESKNLVKVYYMMEGVKKQNGTNKSDITTLPVKKSAVLGAGVMGGGIAQLFTGRDIPSRVKDINYDAVGKAYQQAASVLKGKVKRRRITKLEMCQILQKITGTIDYTGFKSVDFIVEAIVEDLEIKKTVFKELEENIREDAVVVTNTSSLLVDDMAAAFKHPERFVGMHFFNPVHMMPLVEVIRGKDSTDEAVATTFQLAKALGKTPVVVSDGPGFLVNRLLVPYMVESVSLLEEGHGIQKIDKAMLNFGMPMGPIELFDEVGIDVAFKVAKILGKSMGDRMAESDILENMVNDGKIGKKSNVGFYKYEGKKKIYDSSVESYISVKNKTSLSDEELIQRMVYPMINEAARCLDEKIVTRPQDVDLGMIFGTGFAPFRGGLLNYADSEGIKKVNSTLEKFAQEHGARFKQSDALQKMAVENKKFYEYWVN